MPLCNGVDIGCVSYTDNITGRESGLTSLYGASHERTCPLLLNSTTTSKKLDKIAETPQIGIRASANMWRNPHDLGSGRCPREQGRWRMTGCRQFKSHRRNQSFLLFQSPPQSPQRSEFVSQWIFANVASKDVPRSHDGTWHVDRFGVATNSSRVDAKRENHVLNQLTYFRHKSIYSAR